MDLIQAKDLNLGEEELIKYYCSTANNFTKNEICSILNTHHGMSMTVRRMKYLCNKYGLQRRKHITDSVLEHMVANELETSNALVGFRQMAELVSLKYCVRVAKERVRCTLKRLDPEGVKERSRNVIKRRVYETFGPNDVYHIDGNDKLKKWGFCIHRCVDGFSRKLLWLKVATTNNDPLVIANYYLQHIKTHKIVPNSIRMDKGSENIYCDDLQAFFTGDPIRYFHP